MSEYSHLKINLYKKKFKNYEISRLDHSILFRNINLSMFNLMVSNKYYNE